MGLSIKRPTPWSVRPGSPFEVIAVEHDGVTDRTFKNAPATLRQFFDTARGLDQTFIVYEDEEWTFAEVMDEADALGYALVHHFGVKPGDRVGIAMRNYPEWIISFAAILSIGAISVSLNAWWTEQEMEYAINDARTVGPDRRHRADRTRRRRVPTRERRGCSACASTNSRRWRRTSSTGTTSSCAASPMPEVRVQRGHGRHDPLHVGHDGVSQGRGLDARGHLVRRSWPSPRAPPSSRRATRTRRVRRRRCRRASSSSCRSFTSRAASR